MEDQILRYLIPASGLISGLIGAFVGLQNRALLAEVRKELAELENRIITRINGTYVRAADLLRVHLPASQRQSAQLTECQSNTVSFDAVPLHSPRNIASILDPRLAAPEHSNLGFQI